jgi:hypothetical protein
MQEVMAAHEVQWVVCFQLACVVQQLQRKSKKQQQQQQQQQQGSQPVEELLAALGLPAGFDCSRYVTQSEDEDRTLVLLSALEKQLDAASCKMTFQGVPVGTTSAAEPAGSIADAAADTASDLDQQSSCIGDDKRCVFIMMSPQLLQAVMLTLVQLCGQGQPSLQLLVHCLAAMFSLLAGCTSTMSRMSEEALTVTGFWKLMTPDMKAAAAAASSGCRQVLGALTEPILNQLGPAVLKAVRRVEKPQGSRQASSSSRSVQASGLTGDLSPEQLADAAMNDLGRLVIQYISHGEQLACKQLSVLSYTGRGRLSSRAGSCCYQAHIEHFQLVAVAAQCMCLACHKSREKVRCACTFHLLWTVILSL